MRITARRYPCPGCKKTMIWRYAAVSKRKGVPGTFSYGHEINRCWKCARKEHQAEAKVEKRKRLEKLHELHPRNT
jgi:hypothetical protein